MAAGAGFFCFVVRQHSGPPPHWLTGKADAQLTKTNSTQITTKDTAMEMQGIPFGTTDWAAIPRTEHPGEVGKAFWKTQQFGGIRVRMVVHARLPC